MSLITLWISQSLVYLHYFGRSSGVFMIWFWVSSSSMTWFWFWSWSDSWSFSSRFMFSKIPTQSITSTYNGLGLDSSKVTWIDSSVVRIIMLNTLKKLLEVEYPMSMPSSSFMSNFPRVSFLLLWINHFHPKTHKLEIFNFLPLYSS